MNILVIGAHFDDIEIGCGGTIARMIKDQHKVWGYVASSSSYRSLDNKIQRSSEIAEKEGRDAAKLLGYELSFDQYETTKLKHNDNLINRLETMILDNNIDLVFTHWTNDLTEDHRAVAEATAIAARKGTSVLMYRSNFYKFNKPFSPSVYIDISPFINEKKAAILCHKSEVDKFGESWLDSILATNKVYGQESGHDYSEAFEIFRLVY